MRILGVITGTKDLHVAVVTSGTASATAATLKKVVLPIDEDESARLHRTLQLLDTLLLDEKVDRIAVVKAGQAKFGNASSLRHKVECVVQLAGVGRNLPVTVVSPQTLRAFEKKNDPQVLVGDAGFSPVGSRDAALAAWIELRKHDKS
jgi:intracellular sulfur oxidation DsrE/DsrF family protein